MTNALPLPKEQSDGVVMELREALRKSVERERYINNHDLECKALAEAAMGLSKLSVRMRREGNESEAVRLRVSALWHFEKAHQKRDLADELRRRKIWIVK